jgi:hypothetical protein
LIKKGNLNLFYSYVNRKIKSGVEIDPLSDGHGRTADTDRQKCQILSEYFASVYTADDSNQPTIQKAVKTKFHFTPVDEHKVYDILRQLPSRNSTSPDNIPYISLKNCALSMAKPLSILFNRSMFIGRLSKIFKTAIIRPIFKKGNKTFVSNYRPILLTCCVSKVLERIIIGQLLGYLLGDNLISRAQYGFLPKLFTGDQLLNCLNKWHHDLNSGRWVDCVYVDHEKDFDSVSIPKLLIKMESFGISASVLQWFRNFLTENKTEHSKFRLMAAFLKQLLLQVEYLREPALGHLFLYCMSTIYQISFRLHAFFSLTMSRSFRMTPT